MNVMRDIELVLAAPNAVKIIPSRMIAEFAPVAVEDADERFEAMTSHCIVLDLLPLTEPQPVIWQHVATGTIYCHPNTLAKVRAMLI